MSSGYAKFTNQNLIIAKNNTFFIKKQDIAKKIILYYNI